MVFPSDNCEPRDSVCPMTIKLDEAPPSEAKNSARANAAVRLPHRGADHVVQFYESDEFLADCVSEFLAAGAERGESSIIIATAEHRTAVEQRLSARGFDLAKLKNEHRYFSLDAKETMSRFMVSGKPDEKLFNLALGRLITEATRGRRHVRAFGEMVAILCAEKKHETALEVEELWNGLSNAHSFSLLCAYPTSVFLDNPRSETITHICDAHSHVRPSESFIKSGQTEDERLRRIALLEYKSRLLEAEIAKRKQVEEGSRLLASIVAYSDDAIISKDLNGVITSWNAGAQRIFGYTAEEIVGHSVTELMPPDRQHEEPQILARLRNGERIDHYETVRRRKDGADIEVSLTVSPLKDDTGRVVGASKIARDITEQKRVQATQQALYELTSIVNRAAKISEVYKAALDAICRSQSTDRAAVLLYEPDGVMRFKVWRNLSPEYRRDVENHPHWRREDKGPEPICIEDVRQASLDEPLRKVILREGIESVAFLPVSYNGRLLGKLMIYHNAPHRFKTAELHVAQTIVSQIAFAIERHRSAENLERMVNERTASLREAIAQMEEFSYSVSHDLRAPVRAMQCYAEVLMEDYGDKLEDTAKKYLSRIIQGGARMDRLIQDILTYSRLSRREVRLQPISLDKLTHEIVRQFHDLAPRPESEISVEGKLPDVVGHEPSLSQAISNLLNNAVKFVEPGTKPKVRLYSERLDGHVRLWIADNGIGIKPEYQHRLFSVFER